MLNYMKNQEKYWESFRSIFYKYSDLPNEMETLYENKDLKIIDVKKDIGKLIISSFSYKKVNKIEKEWQQKQIDLYFNINSFNIIDNKSKIEEDCGKWLANDDFQLLIKLIENEINRKENVEELQTKLNDFFDNHNRDIINNDYFFPSKKDDDRYIYSKQTIKLLLNIWFLRLSYFIIHLSLYTRCEYYDDKNIVDNIATSYIINRNLYSKSTKSLPFIYDTTDLKNPNEIYSNQFLNYFVKQRLILINPLNKQGGELLKSILLFDYTIESYLIYDSWINKPISGTESFKSKEEPYRKIINFTMDLLYKKDITLNQFNIDNKFKEVFVQYLNTLTQPKRNALLKNIQTILPK
jgi:hypothetical protein